MGGTGHVFPGATTCPKTHAANNYTFHSDKLVNEVLQICGATMVVQVCPCSLLVMVVVEIGCIELCRPTSSGLLWADRSPKVDTAARHGEALDLSSQSAMSGVSTDHRIDMISILPMRRTGLFDNISAFPSSCTHNSFGDVLWVLKESQTGVEA